MNIAMNLSEDRMQKTVLHSLPRYLDVVLTKKCNIECIFCKKYETFGDQQVSIENFKEIARQLFPTAASVNFSSGGDPYMHAQLIELMRICQQYKVRTTVSSNGMLLNEQLSRTIVKEELISQHTFSLDGIKASTVEAIRVNTKLDIILDNIKMFIRICNEKGKRSPSIHINYALMRSNIEELPDAVRYWGKMGIAALHCGYVSICRDIDQNESLYFHQELTEQVFKEARRIAAHYPNFILYLPHTLRQEQDKKHVPKKCACPWRFVMIDCDGRVFPCYRSWGAITMGNIYKTNSDFMKNIWNNSTYQALRRTTNNDTLKKHFPYCAVCEVRFGWENLTSHLGDETWFRYLDVDSSERNRIIAHRSPYKEIIENV